MQLGKADLVCFALRSMADLDQILAVLARVTRPVRA
jgi:ubiquinone/menaquinone biosynthesis C-methylase UbiE